MLLGAGDRIYQILQNLLGNAAKFTERGAIELRVSCRASAEPHKLIRIEISDTGPGIPDEVQPRLFNAFEQGGPEIARRFGGTGLGLVICKRLVDLMGGRISFTSRVGVGTTFCVELSLPVTEQTPAAVPRQGATLGSTTRPLRVLVAEDTPASQMVVQAMLEKQGHSVHLVGNGREAVDAARLGGFDVVLMDLQMPVMDGLEAAGEIRALPAPLGDVPIVALTAHQCNCQALPDRFSRYPSEHRYRARRSRQRGAAAPRAPVRRAVRSVRAHAGGATRDRNRERARRRKPARLRAPLETRPRQTGARRRAPIEDRRPATPRRDSPASS